MFVSPKKIQAIYTGSIPSKHSFSPKKNKKKDFCHERPSLIDGKQTPTGDTPCQQEKRHSMPLARKPLCFSGQLQAVTEQKKKTVHL